VPDMVFLTRGDRNGEFKSVFGSIRQCIITEIPCLPEPWTFMHWNYFKIWICFPGFL